jgi:hypothetical protein
MKEEAAVSREKLSAGLSAHLEGLLDRAEGQGQPAGEDQVREDRGRMLRAAQSDMRGADGNARQIRRLQVEYHKKLSIPFACVVFVLVGAPLGIRSRRGGIGIGAGTGILFFLVYYLFLVGGEQLGDRGLVSPLWAMWAPNVFFGGLGIFLTLSVSREWRATPVTRAVDFIMRAPRRTQPSEQTS